MRWLVSLLTLSILSISAANAKGILVEPIVGYNVNTTLNMKDSIYKKDYFGSGGAVGGRLGYQNFGFQLGVDFLRSSVAMSGSEFTKNVTLNEWAGFVGFEFPILLRVYAGYIMSAAGTSKFDQGTHGDGIKQIDLRGGTGGKIGVGLTPLPFLDLNVEYRSGQFNDYKIGDTTFDEKVKYSSYLLSVSVPLNL
jgi:hypothetical protein